MKAYITSIGSISPQPSFGNEPFMGAGLGASNYKVIEPDYSPWIDSRSIRRMSKVIRMGVASALLALKEAEAQRPDAIIVGTGLGCLEDTGIFLNKLIENNEEALNPTPFIQSTHNTISSQIALLLQCFGYNQTFTQRGFSFELAIQDALLLLNENNDYLVLVGGVDESTNVSDDLFRKLGITTINGEGASFFALSNSSANAWAQIVGLKMVYKPLHASDVTNEIDALLASISVSRNEIDFIVTGSNGDERYDSLLNDVMHQFKGGISMGTFKNLCGEFSTASGFGLWIACMMLKKGFMPFEVDKDKVAKPVKTILLYNQYLNQHHSLILLRAC